VDTPEQLSNLNPVPQLPPTVLQEISLFVQRMPAWLFALLSLVGIFLSYQVVGGLLLLAAFGLELSNVNVNAYRWATMVGQVLFILVPTVILARLRFPRVENVFRFGKIHLGQILLVVIAVFALQQLLQGYLMVQESVPIQFPPFIQDIIDMMKTMMEEMYRMLTRADSLSEFLVVVIVIAVTPAICEELMFRGLIQRTLEGTNPSSAPSLHHGGSTGARRGMTAAISAGIIFGIYHMNPFTLIPLAALGVYFGFIVYRTQNIVPAMVAHFFNNFLACLAAYLKLDDDFLAIAPTEKPTATVLALNFSLSAIVFLAATWYFVRITKPQPEQQQDELPRHEGTEFFI
jgi:hypothetical protein